MYDQPFYLEEERGNNAFAFTARGEHPRLYVPSLIQGTLEDVLPGENVVFSDFDEYGVLQECTGLKNFVQLDWNGVPTFVMDNHNHALFFWYLALAREWVKRGATLVHVDQHKDMREPPELLSSAALGEVFEYTNKVVNVGNYIVPAIEEGLVGEVQLVTGEAHLENEQHFSTGNKILNIDLDFFAPELSYIDFDAAQRFILEHLEGAGVVTIASSPFFIEQEAALDFLARLTEPC